MDQKTLQNLADKLWIRYGFQCPKIVNMPCPTIIINNRLTKCAGYMKSGTRELNLSGKFLAKFEKNMINVILPHELAHQIDYDVFGWYARKPHHGKCWIEIMVKIGQKPEPYHTMVL